MTNTESMSVSDTLEGSLEESVAVETFPPENNQFDNMVYTLPMMGKGMLGIFLVTIIIVVGVVILNKVTGGKKGS